MTFGRRFAARLRHLPHLAGLALAAGTTAAGAQTVALSVPRVSGDSISPAPVISVVADQVPTNLQPSTLRLVIARSASPTTPIVIKSTPALTAQFLLDSLLPSGETVIIRGQLLDRNGNVRAESDATVPVRSWLRVISPAATTNVLATRQPQFVWSSPPITLPPGPWTYRVDIINTATRDVFQSLQTNDTTITPTTPLQACTSYSFTITGTAQNGAASDRITVFSRGTFVIQSIDCPSTTIAFQNFPNPFGRGTNSGQTCFWFDLAHRSAVKLIIYDIRLREVKHLVPGLLPAVLDSGAYGRQQGTDSGCDPRLLWDGTDDRGRRVPPGVYVEVFDADGRRETKKLVYKGP